MLRDMDYIISFKLIAFICSICVLNFLLGSVMYRMT